MLKDFVILRLPHRQLLQTTKDVWNILGDESQWYRRLCSLTKQAQVRNHTNTSIYPHIGVLDSSRNVEVSPPFSTTSQGRQSRLRCSLGRLAHNTPHTPLPAPCRDALPARLRAHAAHRAPKGARARGRLPASCQAWGAADQRRWGRGGRDARRPPPAPPQAAASGDCAERHCGATARSASDKGNRPRPRPTRGPSAQPAPPPPSCTQRLRHIQ